MRRVLVAASLLGALGLLSRPLRAEAQAKNDPTWEPGNSTTSHVKGEVEADDSGPSLDGVYGRFEGDLDLALGGGIDAGTDVTLGALRASAHYFSTIGLYVGYADRLSSASDDERDRRRLSLGVDLRPAFVPRWSKNLQQGPRFVDLTVDSISLGLGVWWADPPDGSFGERRGLELSVGFGVSITGDASGLWLDLRGLLRWADPARDPGETAEGALLAVLSWHQMVLGPLTK